MVESMDEMLRLKGVSSFEDLISNDVHRICLWVIGVATLLGNAIVLGGRHLAKTENRILTSFVKNLAGILSKMIVFTNYIVWKQFKKTPLRSSSSMLKKKSNID